MTASSSTPFFSLCPVSQQADEKTHVLPSDSGGKFKSQLQPPLNYNKTLKPVFSKLSQAIFGLSGNYPYSLHKAPLYE